MSALQVKKYNQEELLFREEQELIKQADAYYLDKHFRVGCDYDENKFIESLLLTEVLSNCNCDVVNFINKKIRGALGDENIDIVNLKTVQTKYRDINNYYYTIGGLDPWQAVDW